MCLIFGQTSPERKFRSIRPLTGEDLVLDNGAVLSEISSDTSEQLEIIPATVKVIQYVRYKYAVKGQEELGIYIADMPTQPIAKSIASSKPLRGSFPF